MCGCWCEAEDVVTEAIKPRKANDREERRKRKRRKRKRKRRKRRERKGGRGGGGKEEEEGEEKRAKIKGKNGSDLSGHKRSVVEGKERL